jgi:predicted GNAT family acetyltransferase
MERDGKRLAEMTYTVAGSRVIIDHTTVDDALRGTGAGVKLVEAAVQWARAEHVKLMPLCPYAKSVFDKTPQYADVLAD